MARRPPSASLQTVPVRTCVGCRQRADKRDLLRVTVRNGANGLSVGPDPSGTAPGRGAHLHPTAQCLDQAVRRRAFARALRTPSQVELSVTDLVNHINAL